MCIRDRSSAIMAVVSSLCHGCVTRLCVMAVVPWQWCHGRGVGGRLHAGRGGAGWCAGAVPGKQAVPPRRQDPRTGGDGSWTHEDGDARLDPDRGEGLLDGTHCEESPVRVLRGNGHLLQYMLSRTWLTLEFPIRPYKTVGVDALDQDLTPMYEGLEWLVGAIAKAPVTPSTSQSADGFDFRGFPRWPLRPLREFA
eukprot:TRINITY_DN7376_c0_g1_i3.p1 TRINITY_DN7376_c0_g1~~TRINITY_DN7376_c0_g1_i3.p1  ORF type:complete len:206 (+),score=24.46 TRINITY_DN7376_c0_g1_i3:31-618(+)